MDEEKNDEKPGINQWIKDNIRILISIAIVIAIAGGIYSYSKRTQPQMGEEMTSSEEVAKEAQEPAKISGDQEKTSQPQEEQKVAKEEKTTKTTSITTDTSKETESSFIETAGRGDGVTHLARRALANYLEKNPDSALKPEHKIYIEDYLRKHVGFRGKVHIGTSIEFNKDLVRQAIEQSKKLNENQLKNLHKYVVLVPSLT